MKKYFGTCLLLVLSLLVPKFQAKAEFKPKPATASFYQFSVPVERTFIIEK